MLREVPIGRTLGMVLAASGGAALAVQSKINSDLAESLHDPVITAVVSFGVGFCLLWVGVGFGRSGRSGLRAVRRAVAQRELAPWHCMGGVSGAFLVITQGLTVGVVGVAIFTVAVVAGQVVSGLGVDRAGLGPTGAQPLTGWRVAGGVLSIVAVGIAVGTGVGGTTALWLAALPAVAGVAVSFQQAFNGRVRVTAGNAFVAACVNFSAGLAVLVLAGIVDIVVRGLPDALPGTWWLYTGGVLGIWVVAAAAAAVRMIGVLLLGLATVTGQLVTGLVLDLLFPAAGRAVGAASVFGTVLLLVAVAVASVGGKRAPRGPGTDERMTA